ncbi:MAG: hypothetical protein ABIU63_16290 [Chitinophagaceae bacterium]
MPKLIYKIEPNQVTLRPKSWLVIMVIVLAIPFAGILALSFALPELGKSFAMIMLPFMLIVMGIPFILSRQKAVFDASAKIFYRSVFNIKFRSVPFTEIDGVSAIPVRGISAGEYFRLILKKDRYGGGVRLSKAYLVTNKQYLIWSKELMPAISKTLQLGSVPLAAEPVVSIGEADFSFYKPTANGYKSFTRSAMGRLFTALLGGVVLFGGVFGLSLPEKGSDRLITYLIIGMGVIILMSLTNKVTIAQKEICKSQFLGLIKTKRSTENFINFSTLRRSTNAIYNGTDVSMNFTNEETLSLRSFYRTQKIERFMAETKKAMSLN